MITVNYPIAFKKKVLGGVASLIHDDVTTGSVSTYFKSKSLSQCYVTHDTNDSGATKPLFYLATGV